jgi:hypothetical protein
MISDWGSQSYFINYCWQSSCLFWLPCKRKEVLADKIL